VKPWIHLGTATIPGGGELRLMQRDRDFSIMLGTMELMSSRLSGSEEAMALFTWERIADRKKPKILIGGLGMGFTLRAAQGHLPPDAEITVAELVPEVVDWARGPLAELFGGCLDDRRVTIREEDVLHLIREGRGQYDAILLDVDNGPEGFSRKANDRLYSLSGLGSAVTALKPGGVLTIWSAASDSSFTWRLRQVGFSVEEKRVRARGRAGGARHVIWLATNGPSRGPERSGPPPREKGPAKPAAPARRPFGKGRRPAAR
jgi:spermidine synthase